MAQVRHRPVVEIQLSPDEAQALKDFFYDATTYPDLLQGLLDELEENL